MYKFGILTSLFDDEAPKLMETLNNAIESGLIEAEVPLVFCDKMEGKSPEIDERARRVRQLKHMKNLVFLPPSKIESSDDIDQRRLEYDSAAAKILSGSGANVFLNIGYMRIMTKLLYGQFDIVNLHPALPETGPVGMWPDVMREQAERPLSELMHANSEEMAAILQKHSNKAGGMLHLVSDEVDRGPVVSWYGFSLASFRLNGLWTRNAENARTNGISAAKSMPAFSELAGEIRREQVRGEHPLLVLTFSAISSGNWLIKNKTLHVGNEPRPNGVDMTEEIGRYLTSKGIETAIS